MNELPGYDRWKLATPPEYEWPSGPDADPNAEDYARIDAMKAEAKTAEDWLVVQRLCKAVDDEPPFHFDHSPYEQMVAVTRSDWDLGMPSGMGRTEAEAITDLLEQEG